jgi:hypothetical protein
MRVAVLTAGFSVGGGGRDYTPPSTAKANPGVRSKAALMQSAEDRLLIPHSERSFELYCEGPKVHFGYLGVHLSVRIRAGTHIGFFHASFYRSNVIIRFSSAVVTAAVRSSTPNLL